MSTGPRIERVRGHWIIRDELEGYARPLTKLELCRLAEDAIVLIALDVACEGATPRTVQEQGCV